MEEGLPIVGRVRQGRELRQTRTVDPPPTVLQTEAPHTVLQMI